MFVRLMAKMSDPFLDQWINIKFCVKLGKNASNNCAMLFEAYGGEGMKKSIVLEWQKRFKERCENCSSLCSISRVLFALNSMHKAKQSTKLTSLYGNIEADTWRCAQKKSWTLAQWLNFPPWQCSSSQGALCQAVLGPKLDYWNGIPTLFPWFCSE
jgi:hypothetical protein